VKSFLFAAFLLVGISSGLAQTAPGAAAADHGPGARTYRTLCAVCHQPDGGGMASLAPRLAGDPLVAGDSAVLIKLLLQGPAAVLPSDRPHYQNVMPPMAGLSDKDLAAVLTFVRKYFGNGAAPVTAGEVAIQRPTP
jgi:mono/diheme cytochrome c family protein